MTLTAQVAAAERAVREFWRGAPGRPTLAARLLKPVYRLLSVETRIHIASDDMIGLTAASLKAREVFGETGNIVIDGDEIRVGTGRGDAFVMLGRGRTWEEAFDDARARAAERG